MIRLGVDLGGTKIEIIALSESGQERVRQRKPTPQGDYEATLKTIEELVVETERQLDMSNGSLGIGVPGSLSPTTGRMRNANSECLNGMPLQGDLEKLLKRPVVISNDANCFALSEASDGAGKEAGTVFAVIVGTGTGAGLVCEGKVVNGHNGIAGEWGHNPLPWMMAEEYPGRACWCGLKGCIETFLSGAGLSANLRQETLSAETMVARAASGDALAEAALAKYARDMAKALAHVINVLDPEVIVLGGGLSNIQRLYTHVPELWGEYIFSDEVRTRLLPPKFGDSSGVRGAAWLGAASARHS